MFFCKILSKFMAIKLEFTILVKEKELEFISNLYNYPGEQ
jgi:hypothetical protein